MGQDFFDFKQFRIEHSSAAMRVNTDGVLLGAWTDVSGIGGDGHLLDIGAGSGVITLMLAQRTAQTVGPPRIDAVEIDTASSEQALKNIIQSKWKERIEIFNCNVCDFQTATKYRIIVSNPPYFVNSLTAPDAKRTTARHTADLSYGDLADAVARLLTPDGQFSIILPAGENERLFCEIADKKDLYLHRRTTVYSKLGTAAKRVLMEFRKTNNEPHSIIDSMLTIEDNSGYSTEYKQLTKDFYLKF